MPIYKTKRHVDDIQETLNSRLLGVHFATHLIKYAEEEYHIRLFKCDKEINFLRVFGHDNAYRALNMLYSLLTLTDGNINLT